MSLQKGIGFCQQSGRTRKFTRPLIRLRFHLMNLRNRCFVAALVWIIHNQSCAVGMLLNDRNIHSHYRKCMGIQVGTVKVLIRFH